MAKFTTGTTLPTSLNEGDYFYLETEDQLYEGPIGGGTPVISGILDDNTTANTTTWSSSKLNTELTNLSLTNQYQDYTLVTSVNDFPTPDVNGDIQLQGSHTYEISGTVDIGTNRLISGDETSIIGKSTSTDKLIYTGTDEAIRLNDVGIFLTGITITTANGTGIRGVDTTGTKAINSFTVSFVMCNEVADVDGFAYVSFSENAWVLNGDGLIARGNIQKIGFFDTIILGNLSSASDAVIELATGAIVNTIDVNGSLFDFGVGIGIKMDSNTNVGENIILTNDIFRSGVTALQGIEVSDDKVRAVNCVGILNTNEIPTEKVVRVKGDFPDPVGGVITLKDNIQYRITGQINLGTDRIELGASNLIYGQDKSDDVLVYTGTSSMISGTDRTFSIKNVALNCTSAGSQVFDLINTTRNENMEIRDCIFANTAIVGRIEGYYLAIIRNNLYLNIEDGWTFPNGIQHLFFIDNILQGEISNVNGAYIHIASTYNGHAIEIRGNYFHLLNTGNGTEMLDIDNGLTVDNGILSSNFFTVDAGITILGGTTPLLKSNLDWRFSGNLGLSDSSFSGFYGFVSNTDATTFTAASQYVKVAGTNEPSLNGGERIDVTSVDNRATSTDKIVREIKIIVTGSISTSENNTSILPTLFKNQNGVTTTDTTNIFSQTEVFAVRQNESVGFSFQARTTLQPNDHVELFVANLSGIGSVTVTDLQLSIEEK